MEEKILLICGSDLQEINQYLKDGWTVKSITATHSGLVYAYAVIQRQVPAPCGLDHVVEG